MLDHAKRQREEAKKSSQGVAAPASALAPGAMKNVATPAGEHKAAASFNEKNGGKRIVQALPEQRKLDARTRQQQSETTKPLRKELEKIDLQMQALHSEKQSLQTQLAPITAPSEMAKTGKRLKTIEGEISTLEERWLELTELIETAAV